MGTIDTQAQDRADMEKLAAGHDAALSDLMERHAGPIFQFLYRLLGNEEDAHDLAQETFVRVYRHRERFDSSGKFTTWFYTIASNLARNEYRRRGRHPNVPLEGRDEASKGTLADVLPSEDVGPSVAAEMAEAQEAVSSAVQALPEDLREAI